MPTPTPGFVSVDATVIEELQVLVGHEQVITSDAEVESLSKDCYWYSPVLASRLQAHKASVAVKVGSVAELKSVLAIAFKNNLPVTVRGGATGNYGQCIPLCGGLVVDVTGLDRITRIEDGVVTTEPGVRVVNLERAVREKGYELRCLPSTWVKSTIGGFIAGGTGGIGSISWGVLRDLGTIKRIKLLTLEAEPKEIILDEDETLNAFHAYGTNGVIVELQLRLAPSRRWDQVVVTGPFWTDVTAFATRVAYDDAIPKRLVSLLEPAFGASFKPLRKWLPEGHSIIWLEVEQSCTESVVAEARKKGLNVAQVIPHQDPKRQPMIMEYAWNHSTLWMLKSHPGHTYLQLGVGSNFAEQGALLQKRFPGQVYLHFEFVRGRGPTGEFGAVLPVLLPVVKFTSEDNLREIMAFAEEIGIANNNPHTCYLGEVKRDARLDSQAALKLKADPKGLLNPGKLRGAKSNPALAATFPKFLYT
jgi:FAD/FMN-containing dehydrogenase